MFLEKKAKDDEQQRLKRRWQEDKSREDAKRLKEQRQEKEKEEKSRRIEELRKQLKELEHAESPEDEEMKGEPDDDLEHEEEYEEGDWEDDQGQWPWTEQEEEKGTSSKESSYILIDSTKDSPKEKSSTTQGKVAAGTSPKPKEADKEWRKKTSQSKHSRC